MNETVLLTRASLLSALLFSVHVVGDWRYGFDPMGPQNLGLCVILLVWVYVTLMLMERRWAQVIVLLLCLGTAAMPILHRRAFNFEFFKRDGASLFLWTLAAMGTCGAFGALLAARALIRRRAVATPI